MTSSQFSYSEADRLVELLVLKPHPEGGHYRETFRDRANPRGFSSAIYFLLKAGEVSHWHRIDATEIWHFYRGAPLVISVGKQRHVLGPGLEQGECAQIIVPAWQWQSASSLGDYSLVGCTVAPAFLFSAFELAAQNFQP